LRINFMLRYAIAFAIMALFAGLLGFGVLSGAMAMAARICLVIFLVLFVVALFFGKQG
jgi:uncharacterized membrane protein YtjA (UPF0391 family)